MASASWARVRGCPSRSSSKTSLARTSGSQPRRLLYVQQRTFAELSTEVRDPCHSVSCPAAVPLPAVPARPARSGRRSDSSLESVSDAPLPRRAGAQRSGAHQELRRQHGAGRRRPRPARRPGARAGRRERRRQVDADEDPRRRPPGRQRAPSSSDGDAVSFSHPVQAQQAGVSTVFQEFNLLPERTVAENVYLGREPRRFGLVDLDRMQRDTQALLDDLGVTGLRATQRVRQLSVAEQQVVEIAKALSYDAQILSDGRADRSARRPRGRAPLLDHRAADRPRRRDPLRLAPAQGDLRPLRHDHRAQGRPSGRPPDRPPSSTTPSWSG